ncbi:Transcription factor AP-4 [Fasciolopsis buskii]|uniref:Transcription factor AP-4 n=1 Tax=Fasciolopsis buskii TaxID=27845 RepID=A0A8E0S157_9TREM|nr:Transcription factor AP-4 [Fasciolopsis buski]
MEKRRSHVEYSPDACDKTRRSALNDSNGPNGQDHLEQEKRVRREIANSNERRRMQSINAGFDSLRILLPPMQDGEKMSKATILQLTAEYINNLVHRVNLLEHEIAAYRQSSGIQPSTVIPEFSLNLPPPRKRRLEEQRRRAGGARSRRRRADANAPPEVSRQDFLHCSPTSADTRQTSPSNSFIGSVSVSPTSPLPESGSSTSARLEHLVMAIEQIEGGRALNVSPGDESHGESFSTGDQSPPLPSEACWQSPQETYHGCVYSDANSALKPLNPFPDVLMLTPVPDVPAACPVTEADPHLANSTDFPVNSKFLNRPIPHKYLHRPQVVVNSSH